MSDGSPLLYGGMGWVRIVWDGSIKRCIVHRAGVCKLSANCFRVGVDIDDDVSWVFERRKTEWAYLLVRIVCSQNPTP